MLFLGGFLQEGKENTCIGCFLDWLCMDPFLQTMQQMSRQTGNNVHLSTVVNLSEHTKSFNQNDNVHTKS
jgi:hypothetical protein